MSEEQRSAADNRDTEPVPRDPDQRGEVFEGEGTSDTAVRTAFGAALPGAVGGLVGGAGVGASVDNRNSEARMPPSEDAAADDA